MIRLITFLFITFTSTVIFAGAGIDATIDVTIENMKDDAAYLAYYEGDKQYYKDTAAVIDGRMIFKGNYKPGVYMVIYDGRGSYFELILTEAQIKLKTKITDVTKFMRVEESEENKLFYSYIRDVKNHEGKDRLNYMNSFCENYPESYTTKLILSTKDPVVPECKSSMDAEECQFYQFYSYRNDYFKNIDLKDDFYLRTPTFSKRFNHYFEKMVMNIPDSLIEQCDQVLGMMHTDSDMFKYALAELTSKYAKSRTMGHDAIYVHLVQKYYCEQQLATWTTEETRKRMCASAENLSQLLIGQTAPQLNINKVNGTPLDLESIKGNYTVLFFWDENTATTKGAKSSADFWKDLSYFQPALDSAGVSVVAVYIGENLKAWNEQVQNNETKWIHAGDILKMSKFRDRYILKSAPRLFILDEKKKIVYKNISPSTFVKIIRDK